MSVRRTQPLAEPARGVALALARCERQVALLDRVRPQNLLAEQARLLFALQSRRTPPPAFEYAPRPVLSSLRRELEASAAALDPRDSEQQLLVERALELELEASLVEHLGEPEFGRLAARRFPSPSEPEPIESRARAFLATALNEPSQEAAPRHVADDARDPQSLWCQVSRLLARGLAHVRIEPVVGLVSLAAVAEGVVRIRSGARLSAATSRRIALHEVEGHVRPRERGRELGGVFMAGAPIASEDEEGRAILLEERAGLLCPERRRELGRRYLAADSVRRGAAFWETVNLLGQAGAEATAAIELACRVHRGGGLGRELVYLTGYLRVAAALASRPELERVLSSGRVSVSAAELLLRGRIELDDDGDMV